MRAPLSILLLLAAALPFAPAGCGAAASAPQPAAVREAVARQRALWPEMTLQDLYKSFFQERFGPGHILSDTAAAAAYLRSELASRETFAGPLYEPTGLDGAFYRVNLAVVREGLVPEALLLDAFVRSANGVTMPPIETWQAEWEAIVGAIASVEPLPEGFDRDRAAIDSLLRSGRYAVHHSRRFNEAYDPHYRIVARRIFEEELLPLIESGRDAAAEPQALPRE